MPGDDIDRQTPGVVRGVFVVKNTATVSTSDIASVYVWDCAGRFFLRLRRNFKP